MDGWCESLVVTVTDSDSHKALLLIAEWIQSPELCTDPRHKHILTISITYLRYMY